MSHLLNFDVQLRLQCLNSRIEVVHKMGIHVAQHLVMRINFVDDHLL